MPSSYRPRPVEVKSCRHCGSSFESRHKRTIYCSSSCRTLAYNDRHYFDRAISQAEAKEARDRVKGDLRFSANNIAISAAGATVATLGNFVFNDRPAQKELKERLERLEKEIEYGLNQILAASQYQIDYINAVQQMDPELRISLNQARQQRELTAAKRREKLDKLESLKSQNRR